MATNHLVASLLTITLLVIPSYAKSEDHFGLRLNVRGWIKTVRGGSVIYSMPTSDNKFCGIQIMELVSVSAGSYRNWYQDYWEMVLGKGNRRVQEQLDGFSDKHDVGQGRGNVSHSLTTVSVGPENSVIGVYTAIF